MNEIVRSKPGYGVAPGDNVELTVPDPVELTVEKEDIPLEILYEDEDVAVVNKPCGMVVHPAPGNETGTLVNALLYAMDDLSGIGGVKRPGIVHRLDKDTSGLLMIAKNDQAHESLSEQLRERTMDKRYLAVVDGEMKEPSGRIEQPVARSKKDRKKMAIDPEGRYALTEWTLKENLRGAALLEVHILTGRTHQIRVHMQSIHHPVAGDPIYGAKNGVKAPRLMLHAWRYLLPIPEPGKGSPSAHSRRRPLPARWKNFGIIRKAPASPCGRRPRNSGPGAAHAARPWTFAASRSWPAGPVREALCIHGSG